MKKLDKLNIIESGFSMVELILAMMIAGVFLTLLGSSIRYMVANVDTEQRAMTLEQQGRILHEEIARLVRDASAASVQIGVGCGLVQFNTVTFGGAPQFHHYYSLTKTEIVHGGVFTRAELYDENDTNCSGGRLLTSYMEPGGYQVTFSNNILVWIIKLNDGVDISEMMIATSPRNL